MVTACGDEDITGTSDVVIATKDTETTLVQPLLTNADVMASLTVFVVDPDVTPSDGVVLNSDALLF